MAATQHWVIGVRSYAAALNKTQPTLSRSERMEAACLGLARQRRLVAGLAVARNEGGMTARLTASPQRPTEMRQRTGNV
jgi:hypothetical protein